MNAIIFKLFISLFCSPFSNFPILPILFSSYFFYLSVPNHNKMKKNAIEWSRGSHSSAQALILASNKWLLAIIYGKQPLCNGKLYLDLVRKTEPGNSQYYIYVQHIRYVCIYPYMCIKLSSSCYCLGKLKPWIDYNGIQLTLGLFTSNMSSYAFFMFYSAFYYN